MRRGAILSFFCYFSEWAKEGRKKSQSLDRSCCRIPKNPPKSAKKFL
jgi:hypothetical protein